MSRFLFVVAVVLAAISSESVVAQVYPTKPVRMVAGFAPGGGTDVQARLLARKLGEKLGQSVFVENHSGAAGNIGAQLVARAPADGYTLLYATSTLTVNASLYPNLPFNVVEDFVPVTPTVAVPSVLAVHPSVPVKSVKELIELAKAKPGGITYGSAGSGSATHLAMELFKSAAGINLLHVPYKGSGPAFTDLIGGHVQSLFVFNAAEASANARAGKLRALAVTSLQRMNAFPELPTMQESGFEGYEAISWAGVLAPRGTPREIVFRLNAQIAQAMEELRQPLAEIGGYPVKSTPEEFATYIKAEIVKWAAVVKRTGARAE